MPPPPFMVVSFQKIPALNVLNLCAIIGQFLHCTCVNVVVIVCNNLSFIDRVTVLCEV